MKFNHDNKYELEPGDHDPVRPPGLFLVMVAAVAIGSLGYAIYPPNVSVPPSPTVGGGGPSANTNPADAPKGK